MSIEQIKEEVRKVGDPCVNPRTRLWEDGTYDGDGHDLIACRDIREMLSGCDGSCLDHQDDPNYCKDVCEIKELWKKERNK